VGKPFFKASQGDGSENLPEWKDATFGEFQFGNERAVPGRLKVRLEAFLNGLPTPVERELMQYQGKERMAGNNG
jgi:hypothetical protein